MELSTQVFGAVMKHGKIFSTKKHEKKRINKNRICLYYLALLDRCGTILKQIDWENSILVDFIEEIINKMK